MAYTVFTHLLDASGRLAGTTANQRAASVRRPAGLPGSSPDEHALALEDTSYRGPRDRGQLYDSQTGQRVPLDNEPITSFYRRNNGALSYGKPVVAVVHPAPGAGRVGQPIVLLYMLRLRRTETPISSTSSGSNSCGTARRTRPGNGCAQAGFAVQLLILAALVIALPGRCRGQDDQHRAIVLH